MVKIIIYEMIIDFFLNNSNIYFIFDKKKYVDNKKKMLYF